MPKLTKRAKVPPDVASKICMYIRNGNSNDVAAVCAGIHRDTFYDWMKRGRKGDAGYLEFVAQVDQANAMAEARKVSAVHSAATSGKHWQAAAWWLERRKNERWGKVERHEHSGPDGKPIAIDVTKLSDDELIELAKTGRAGRADPALGPAAIDPEPDIDADASAPESETSSDDDDDGDDSDQG